jgi:hypothetical protein
MKRTRLLARLSLAGVLILVALATVAASGGAPIAAADQPNDATQGRLRVNQCVSGAPPVDVYVNGQVAVNGGVPQTSVPASATSGYLYLTPGTYNFSLVPSGQSPDHPFLGPLNVQVAAGHRYTVVVLGQKEDPTHQALLIDETAAYQAVGAASPDAQHLGHILVNNLKGAPALTWFIGGKAQENGVAYGDFKAALWPAFAMSFGLAQTGPPLISMGQIDGPFTNPPAEDNMDCLFGTFPNPDSHTSGSTSVLNPTDFLQRYTELGASTQGQTPTFHTFLSMLQQTGLTGLLDTGGPYLLFAPTDAAFAALPPAQLARFQADPRAMTALVRAQVVPGYYPPGALAEPVTGGHLDRTVTNLLGTRLVLTDSGHEQLVVNGDVAGNLPHLDARDFNGDFAMVANGTRLFWTDKLLLPAAVPANPAPGMPSTGAGRTGADLTLALAAGLVILLAGGLLRRRVVHRAGVDR